MHGQQNIKTSTDDCSSVPPAICINPIGWHHATKNLPPPTIFPLQTPY